MGALDRMRQASQNGQKHSAAEAGALSRMRAAGAAQANRKQETTREKSEIPTSAINTRNSSSSGPTSSAKVSQRVSSNFKALQDRSRTAEKTSALPDTFQKSRDLVADYVKNGNRNTEQAKSAAYGNNAATESDKNLLERIGAGVGSIGMSFAAAVPLLGETAVQAVKNVATGEKEGLDEDSLGMRWMEKANQLRRDATGGLDGVEAFAADTALSIGQNLAVLPTAVLTPAAPLLIMGAQAGARKAYEVQEEGGGAGEALGRGIVSGGIEAVTEKIPLDNLLDVVKVGGKGVLKNLLKQAGVEATEEGVSYTANYLADKAAGDPNAQFSVDELLRSAAAGGVSGLFFGGVGSAVHSQANGKTRSTPVQPPVTATKTAPTRKKPAQHESITKVLPAVETPEVPFTQTDKQQFLAGLHEGETPVRLAETRPDGWDKTRQSDTRTGTYKTPVGEYTATATEPTRTGSTRRASLPEESQTEYTVHEIETADGESPVQHTVPKPETASTEIPARYGSATDTTPEPDVVETPEVPLTETDLRHFLAGLNEGEEPGKLTGQYPTPRELRTKELEKSLANNKIAKPRADNNALYTRNPELEYSNTFDSAELQAENGRLYAAGTGQKKETTESTSEGKQITHIGLFTQRMTEVGYAVKGFDYYTGDAETLNQIETAFTRLAKDFPYEAKQVTIELTWSADEDDYGRFTPETRTISINCNIFHDWKKAQEKYAELVKNGHFPAGTDARGCFYHEFGHAVGYVRNINHKNAHWRLCYLWGMVSVIRRI